MSRIEELIKEKCPDGVEYIRLEELCSIITKQTGFDYSATIKPALVHESSQDTYSFIQNKDFDGDKINLNTDYYIPIAVAQKYPKITLDTPSILISLSGKVGNVGFYGLDNKAFIGGAVGICKLKDNIVGKFVMYYLMSAEGQKYLFKSVKAASHVNITVESIRDTPIPVPSIEVQQEIVHVLDKFTELETELQAELEARKKQYEYYRDKLLVFDDDVPVKELGDVCKFIRGPFGGSLKKDCFIEDGFAVYEQQHAIYGKLEFRYFVDDKKYNELKRFAVAEGDLIVSCSGTVGRVMIIPPEAPEGIINQALLKLTPSADVEAKYIKYFFENSLTKALDSSARGGAIKNVPSVDELKRLKIAVPSLKEQRRIIEAIDKFNMLCNDYENGLPTEIEARHKQYEYYRDKLLTFERKVV